MRSTRQSVGTNRSRRRWSRRSRRTRPIGRPSGDVVVVDGGAGYDRSDRIEVTIEAPRGGGAPSEAFAALAYGVASVPVVKGGAGFGSSMDLEDVAFAPAGASEILALYAASQAAGGGGGGAELGVPSTLGELLPVGASRVSVHPPGWDDFSSGEDEDAEDAERPLTRDELNRKTRRKLGKSGAKGGKRQR